MGGGNYNGWIPNTSDYKVSSNYGNRQNPFGGGTKFHHGIDIALPTGTALSATMAGEVVYAGMGKSGTGYGGYGYVVAVKDSSGNVHVYAHMDNVSVKKGQKIARGTYLGKSGNSGNSTGPHLHYEVRRGGQLYNTIDPRGYL